MKLIYLLAEDHALDGKDFIQLAHLRSINDEVDLPIIGVSLELDHDEFQPKINQMHPLGPANSSFSFIENFARRRNIPLYASDERKFPEMAQELEMEKKLATFEGSTQELIDTYRQVSKQNLDRRDSFASNSIKSYFNGSAEGVLVHICGLSHLYGLKQKLRGQDFSIKQKILRSPQELTYTKGDLLYSLTDIIAQGVAADEIEDAGTGIAAQIRSKWPESLRRFKKLRRSHSFKQGDVLIDYENTPYLAYLATQPDLYHADPTAVNQSLRSLRKRLEQDGIESCALPKIGCGYGKLDWSDVKPMIEDRLRGSATKFVVFEGRRKEKLS